MSDKKKKEANAYYCKKYPFLKMVTDLIPGRNDIRFSNGVFVLSLYDEKYHNRLRKVIEGNSHFKSGLIVTEEDRIVDSTVAEKNELALLRKENAELKKKNKEDK